MKYAKMTTEQKEQTFTLNVEELYNNHFKEERELEESELMVKINDFESKWWIEEGMIYWDRDSKGHVSFHMNEEMLDEEAVLNIANRHPDLLNENQIQKDIEWYEKISNYVFESWAYIYDNEMELTFMGHWVNTRSKEEAKIRSEELQKLDIPELELHKKTQKIKNVFSAETDEQVLGEMMEIIKKNGAFEFGWIKKISELMQDEFSKLRIPILQRIDYLYSDQFIKDQLEKSELEFDEDLKLLAQDE